MASILVLGVGAIINALAFSGSNYLISKLSGHGEAERKRRDKKIEQLQATQAQWVRRDRQVKDWYKHQRELKRQAGESLKELDEGMRDYYIATIEKAPKLSDFYTPSKQQQDGELTFIVGSLALLGFAVYKWA